jgi:hypothetical protein
LDFEILTKKEEHPIPPEYIKLVQEKVGKVGVLHSLWMDDIERDIPSNESEGRLNFIKGVVDLVYLGYDIGLETGKNAMKRSAMNNVSSN